MVPVPELQAIMPPGFTVDEDEDLLLLRCGWCGWETMYSCRAARPHIVEADALVHRASCQSALSRG